MSRSRPSPAGAAGRLAGDPPARRHAGALPRAAERLLVEFSGEGSGVADLSWGQREIWAAMVRQETWLPIGTVRPLPPGTTVADVAAELRFLMSRYQPARTRLRCDPDGVRQVVSESGELTLEIVDADPGADPAEVAEALRASYAEKGYDLTTEWPVRVGVVRHGGVPAFQVTVMCHLVTDAAGGARMAAELGDWRRARSGGGEPVGPMAAMQPMEQVRWQHTPAGRRVDEAARRRWEGILRTAPPRRFGAPPPPCRPRHWKGEFGSPALHLAVRAIAGRLGVATAPVLLALYAIALARLTGVHPVVVQVVTNNRFRSGLVGAVSPVSQTGLCALDVAGMTVADAVAQARRRAMTAFKYAYYDPQGMDELIARVGRERGEEIDVACYFNDRRPLSRESDGGPEPTPEEVRSALAGSTFDWRVTGEKSFEHLFVHIENVPDRIGITVAGDTGFISPADMEALVRGMERVAVAAAFDPGTLTRVPAT
jgi:hypothetical protein